MANELKLNGGMFLDDGTSKEPLSVPEKLATMATLKHIKHKQSIGFAAEEAIVLGEVTSPGWAIFINRDTANFVNLKVATGGAVFAKLMPGEFALLRLGSGAQAPFAQADTAACLLEYFIALT